MRGIELRGALKSVLSNRGLGIKAKKCLYEGVIVPTALYEAEAWGMRSTERRKVNVREGGGGKVDDFSFSIVQILF